MIRRQPKLPLVSRIISAGCVVLWLAGVSACNLEALFCCDSHDGDAVEHADYKRSHNTRDSVACTNHEHAAGAAETKISAGSHGRLR